jgi:NAD(P)-dependent dehydrogenase (short-subunit alcohol dehydrogenase family)
MSRKGFKDKVAVITGGASGIGKALGYALADQGAQVGLLDMDAEGVASTAHAMRRDNLAVIGLPCDVTDEMACRESIRAVQAEFGGVDILVNNAGITLRDAFVNTRVDAYRKVMEVNFFGALHCTRAAIAGLIDRRGMIIVMSSIAGFAPVLGRSGYCASKYALHGLFDTIRVELGGFGVHVMMVCPTFVQTNLQTRALGGDGHVTHHPQSTVGKMATPEQTARAICAAALRRRRILIPTAMGKAAYWMSRLLPAVYDHIVAKQFKAELLR